VVHYTLTFKLHVQTGTTVLFLNAAIDGVHIGVQVATLKGAHVIAVVKTDEESQLLQELNSDLTIVDTRREGVAEAVRRLTGGLGVDCVAWWSWPRACDGPDTEGGTEGDLLRLLTIDGRLAVTVPHPLTAEDAALMARRGLTLTHIAPHAWLGCPVDLGRWQHVLAECVRILHEGLVIVHVSETVELHHLRDALRQVARHTTCGVVAVVP